MQGGTPKQQEHRSEETENVEGPSALVGLGNRRGFGKSQKSWLVTYIETIGQAMLYTLHGTNVEPHHTVLQQVILW